MAELTWPQRCGMPDLSAQFTGTSLNFVLNRAFCGGGPKDSTTNALLTNFIRLADLAVDEYETARRHLGQAVQPSNDPRLHALIKAANHLEVCIITVHRAAELGRKLRDRSRGRLVRRRVNVLSDRSGGARIRELRNAIAHLDGQLLSDDRTAGDTVCLVAREDGAEFGKLTVGYGELAAWVQELHELATELAGFKESSDHSPEEEIKDVPKQAEEGVDESSTGTGV